ncbi:patatin-like phospholipase family protein [Solirubrobacter sp. CPCC 204708]|uniref:Patatin-like phospholipase family protein n=1 Tax=Solirubrobacter deserti TaxID=2282478 RepID=A0ABT4RCQ9_9ACTN|nr:patatin-like phospholipase family protein [Solirubrobacter deserti]MBE2317888.1 patatin-like phospholipase family protein [Solirubrobacter deserti]MDA0136335.1 patatin-like phospholipase family protein [Solirubrobacter deserti]
MPSREPVGLVLAGGGARGAYEAGVLSVLLPALPHHERPDIVVGASVGAISGSYIAADSDPTLADGLQLWERLRWGDVLATPSLKDLERILRGAINFSGLLSLHVPALLDTTPLGPTLERLIPFERIARTLAVVATSARTGRSVVFHQGGTPQATSDDKRGIDYVATAITETHVRASSAIPALFPAVQLPDGDWYFDGSTRLNAPIKPALAFGAKRIIVIGLNAISGTLGGAQRPDLAAGAALVLDALLADPLTEDLQTLTTINRLAPDRAIPYIFVAPPERDTIGQIARDVFRRHYGGILHAARSPQLAFLGRLIDADADPLHGELLSYLFFAPEFARALIARGQADARRWLAEPHDDGLWDLGPLGRHR